MKKQVLTETAQRSDQARPTYHVLMGADVLSNHGRCKQESYGWPGSLSQLDCDRRNWLFERSPGSSLAGLRIKSYHP